VTTASKPRVIVVGGGIGGLCCALVLHELGADVRVFEAASEIRPLGVGINVLPHAMAVLQRLGLLDVVANCGVRTAELCYFNRFGQLIWSEPRGLHAGYPVPQISVHRGALQLGLLDAVVQRLGSAAVRCGAAFRSSRMLSREQVEATFVDRASDREFVERADLLIGADGIHSTVRRQFYPDEGPPKWNGQVLWRAVSHGLPYLSGRSMFMAGSNRTKFVAYPITEPGPDGLCTINWIAELNLSDQPMLDREDWNRRGDRAQFAQAFASWQFGWIDIPAMIAATDDVWEFPMVDRDPLERWTHERVTLLGDAAHAMYPIGSNGASQAILDAWALGGALRAHGELDAALSDYESERRPATSAIVAANRKGGPEHVLNLAEERAPDGFTHVSEVFAPGELEEIAARYKQVAGFSLDRVR
jgi:2-polyprenyl-6-methoxyphenol hydroxylase-like FAD-dependent oxidoreductase